MARWGMVIDLKRCIGCQGCSFACKVEHSVPPEIFFTKIHDSEFGKYPFVQRHFISIGCMHCEDAPCVEACPAGASIKRNDGIIIIQKELCVGCRYCMVVCPYGARHFNYYGDAKYFGSEATPNEAYGAGSHPKGAVIKCNFCAERIDRAVDKGLIPGIDHDASPACVGACIAGARHFGDLEDGDSEISRLIRTRDGKPLHEELGTRPSIYYLPR